MAGLSPISAAFFTPAPPKSPLLNGLFPRTLRPFTPLKHPSITYWPIGAFGGLVVGMTSVGSGSLMIVLLLLLYPHLKLSDLVGTDLVQAVPLVASAAVGHLLLGDFKFALTGSILVGAIPGVFIGAKLSSHAPDAVLRPALVVVLSASALKLLGAGNVTVGVVAVGVTALVLALGVSSSRAAKLDAATLVPALPPS